MEAWYDLNDVFLDRKPKDVWTSWRSKAAHRYARYVRHLDIPNRVGRPRRVSLVTRAGLEMIYGEDPVPDFAPYPIPVRLTDAARKQIVEGALYTTWGIENPARNVSREVFLAIVCERGAEEFFEPDFLPL